MKAKFSVYFFVRKSDRQIKMRCKFHEYSFEIGIGKTCDDGKWNSDSQSVKLKTEHGKNKIPAQEINKVITEYRSAVSEYFKECDVKKITPSVEDAKRAINKTLGRNFKEAKKVDLFDVFDSFIRSTGKTKLWSDATYKKFTTLKALIREYDDKISLNTLNSKKMESLRDFFISKEYRNAYTNRMFSAFTEFLRWANSEGHDVNPQSLTYKTALKDIPSDVSFLEWDELMQLYNLPLNKSYQIRSRDTFCFMSFTGLRISDAKALTWEQVDMKKKIVSVVIEKTSSPIEIDLNDFALEILNKYKDAHLEENKVLPAASDVKVNLYIKEVFSQMNSDKTWTDRWMCGNEVKTKVYPFSDIISCHDARRTFICNSIVKDIPVPTIMKWTGHKDMAAIKPYVDVCSKDKAKAMKKWNTQEKCLEEMTKEELINFIKGVHPPY